jgi:hypothetical protein
LLEIGERARQRVRREHTWDHRVASILNRKRCRPSVAVGHSEAPATAA